MAFWGPALGYRPVPPAGEETWWAHYRGRLDGSAAFADRLFDPAGRGPAIWFQVVPEPKATKNRLHLDLYATDRDDSLRLARRVELVAAKVAELVALGATVERTTTVPDDAHPSHYVVLRDPEGNEFCVG